MSDTPAVVETSMTLTRPPRVVLDEAKQVADALKDVVEKAGLSVSMGQNRKYLQLEAWQTAGMMFGISAAISWSRQVDVNGAVGYEARAEVLAQDGSVISSAEAMCLNDEEKWSTRPKYEWVNNQRKKVGDEPVPLFQLRSMAQTRAMAKALRNVLSWIVVLAGYQPTPAEEMDGLSDEKQTPGNKQDPPEMEQLRIRARELGEALGKGDNMISNSVDKASNAQTLRNLIKVWEEELEKKEDSDAEG